MAPEQFGGPEATPRTDLYQVGVIALRADHRRGAPSPATTCEILQQVINERPANPSPAQPQGRPGSSTRRPAEGARQGPGGPLRRPRASSREAFRPRSRRASAGRSPPPAAAVHPGCLSRRQRTSLMDKARLIAGARTPAPRMRAAGRLPSAVQPSRRHPRLRQHSQAARPLRRRRGAHPQRPSARSSAASTTCSPPRTARSRWTSSSASASTWW